VTRTSYAKALDNALCPLGFAREGDNWIRVRGDLWECVNRQSSWLGGVTANLLMKDLETEKLFLEVFEPNGSVQMPPIDTRIGTLIDGCDRWWKNDEPNGPTELAEAVLRYGLPWFDQVRTPEQQAENWYGRKTALSDRGYHGPSLVGLALTLHRMGETQEACEVLRKPAPKTAIPANLERVAKVREWLGCGGEATRGTPQG
jgi:hypothetical protein